MSFWSGAGAAAIGAGASFLGASSANKKAKKLMREQMIWDQTMYKSRYQMTMGDMAKAGLNPILAYQQGTGGNMPGASAAPVMNELAGVGPAINSGVSAMLAEQQMEKQEEEIKLIKNQSAKTVAEASYINAEETRSITDSLLKQAQIVLSQSQVGLNSAMSQKTSQETILRKIEEFQQQARAEGAKTEEQIMKSTWGKILKWIDITGRSINPFAEGAASAARSARDTKATRLLP